jgi:hypothetical protein
VPVHILWCTSCYSSSNNFSACERHCFFLNISRFRIYDTGACWTALAFVGNGQHRCHCNSPSSVGLRGLNQGYFPWLLNGLLSYFVPSLITLEHSNTQPNPNCPRICRKKLSIRSVRVDFSKSRTRACWTDHCTYRFLTRMSRSGAPLNRKCSGVLSAV